MAGIFVLIIGWNVFQSLLKNEAFYNMSLRGDKVWQRLLRRYADHLRNKAENSRNSMTPFYQPPPWSPLPLMPYRRNTPTVRVCKKCLKAPGSASHKDNGDGADRVNKNCDDGQRNEPPLITSLQTPTPVGLQTRLQSQPDSALGKYQDPEDLQGPCKVMKEVRSKFKQDSPRGVKKVFTSGTELLCGLHAAQLSMKYQPDFQHVRQPTLEELLDIWKEFQEDAPEGNDNNNFFEVTQLARITQTYLGREGIASRLGVVSPSMGQKMFPIIYSDMEEYKDAEKVLWVYNDEQGSHWEALRSAEFDDSVDMEAYWKGLLDVSSCGSANSSPKLKIPEEYCPHSASQPESMPTPTAAAPDKMNGSTQSSKAGSKLVRVAPGAFATTTEAPHILSWPIASQTGSTSAALITSRATTRMREKARSEGAPTDSGNIPVTKESLLGRRMVQAA